jgi:cytochrome c-type biogenesis protein CcmH/NrfF
LWAAPVVLLALGLFVAVRVIRKRAAVVDEDDVVAIGAAKADQRLAQRDVALLVADGIVQVQISHWA